jgi:hypothetical protein
LAWTCGDLYRVAHPSAKDPKSLPKSMLTSFVGHLSSSLVDDLDRALVAALGIDPGRQGDR